MMNRTQILTCYPGKRSEMLRALEKALDKKPTGMVDMSFTADDTEEVTLVILQAWESKEACVAFQASLPAEKQAYFRALVASKAEAWHITPIQAS